MALNRLATIGLQNFAMDCLIMALHNQISIHMSSLAKGCIILTYIDDCIIVGDSMNCIEALITLLHNGMENFILQDEVSIDKYLGVSIMQLDDLLFNLT